MKNKLNNIALLFFSLVFISMLQSCFLFPGVKSTHTAPDQDTHEQNGFVKATIINYTFDGCSFMLQLGDGKKLEPVNLPVEFRKDNIKVWIKYQHYKGTSICMAGEMVTVIAIETQTSP
ncbi:MAG: hypothetical protein K8R85_06965 [Bacteroidetes bacterium]|nr:hypothetical protein [Bacteroidota bacterium]